MKLIIEFFIQFHAIPLIFCAIILFGAVLVHIFRLHRIEDFKPAKFILIWIVIAAPQIIGLNVADFYMKQLPIHALELTPQGCKNHQQIFTTKDQNCVINGRLIEVQKIHYLFRFNSDKFTLNRCHVLKVRQREFEEYKSDFDELYEKIRGF